MRAADLTTKAATGAPTAGRVMYAGLRARCRVIRSPGCGISPAELDELIAELEPITARLVAAGSR
ncbi:hypothetical protein ABZ215_40820 [Amycolatopsis sp. NPDC006131]|uniref:hypothetical protein n=1 Tax=Amycolatopsis sp. NPDC006131 TaxID=3156731 RepID=UPI0033AA0444